MQNTRYLLGFMVAIGLIILVIFLLFHGSSKPKTAITPKTLVSYATTDADVQLIIDGPINANQSHQEVSITVDSSNVTFQQLQGYQGTVVNQQNFANNETAYAIFLKSLEYAGFTEGNSSPALSDERGYCPLGDRYIFELTQDSNTIERYWATSCGSPKTYNGNVNLTLSLFQSQVPGYDNLTQNISF